MCATHPMGEKDAKADVGNQRIIRAKLDGSTWRERERVVKERLWSAGTRRMMEGQKCMCTSSCTD